MPAIIQREPAFGNSRISTDRAAMVSAAAGSTKRVLGCQDQRGEEEQLPRSAEGAYESASGLGDHDFEVCGRAESQGRVSEAQVEDGLVALAAHFGAQQMDVVGNRDRGEGTIRSEEHTSELQSRLHLV